MNIFSRSSPRQKQAENGETSYYLMLIQVKQSDLAIKDQLVGLLYPWQRATTSLAAGNVVEVSEYCVSTIDKVLPRLRDGTIEINRWVVHLRLSLDGVRTAWGLLTRAHLAGSKFEESAFMKVVILAGGRGTRISEESHMRPKPMVEIGGKPILWHIMKYYSSFGYNDFIVCLGYKGYMIKEYFANYFLHTSDVTIHVKENRLDVHAGFAEPWSITLVDTGQETMTGGRIKRIARFVDRSPFHMTYGDGLSDVDLRALSDFHETHQRAATVTAVLPQGRFGAVEINESDGRVDGFLEKPDGDGRWINGGFFMLTSAVFDVVTGDDCIWEREPMSQLAQRQQLGAFRHRGYWQAMDTLREKEVLEDLWQKGKAPWKKW